MKPWIVRVGVGLTDNYHSRGYALVMAENSEHAIAQVKSGRSYYAIIEHPEISEVEAKEWDGTLQIFPNAGCC